MLTILALGACASLTVAAGAPVGAAPNAVTDSDWWIPNDPRSLGAEIEYRNAYGRVRVLNTGAPAKGTSHPFFTAMGANGRACVTCHQPASAMGLSVESVQRRWQETQGRDPLFAAVDGSNCPSLPQGKPESHSLLLKRGLIRVFLPWPPRAADGTPMDPEFSLEVVKDPSTCNLDPAYGLGSANPMVSVFRRPRPVANMKYLLELPHGVPPHEYFVYNDKSLLPRDPETGAFVSLQLLSDGRQPTLRTQAVDAAVNHLQAPRKPTTRELDAIESLEKSLYAAQGFSERAGPLARSDAPPGLGPEAMRDGAPGELGNNVINRVFGSFAVWRNAPVTPEMSAEERDRNEFRQSVARGAEVYRARRFLIKDVGVYNDKGLGNPFKRSCASGCHNTLLAGMDLAPGFMDLGTNNYPWASREDLPLFKAVCKSTARAQSYLGRVIYTHDPARALITGKCADIGASMTQQLRGLAARAPYFMNGSAATLRELVDLYDRRFNIAYTDAEKDDLVNFLTTL